ncbi:MAG: HAD family hydrolase, partial [Spirochaetales bacterium]|nr:HAD family hydrolase [Spirochaetales bacterium]
MHFRGIIFDKDGTLFDYYSVWGPVFRRHVDRILAEFDRSHDEELRTGLLRLLGISEKGINSDGLIFRHNGASMLMRLFIFSRYNRISYRRLVRLLTQGYYDSKEHLTESLQNSGYSNSLLPLFTALKNSGYTVGVATSDNAESTRVCLDYFGITEYVDMISTFDDHFKKKPNPQSFHAFCQKFCLKPDEVVMVGDAPVDMKYGRRGGAGYVIGVMTGSGDHKRLSKSADVLYPTVFELLKDPKLQ